MPISAVNAAMNHSPILKRLVGTSMDNLMQLADSDFINLKISCSQENLKLIQNVLDLVATSSFFASCRFLKSEGQSVR